jgi:tetratricopeptide (TPR) repeat protein
MNELSGAAVKTRSGLSEGRGLTPSKVEERRALLVGAEALLSELNGHAALALFEKAALISHSPDTEIGIVRAYLQNGAYPSALSFCAHAAGAHEESIESTALYAWLLRIGGYKEHAIKLLDTAGKRNPDDSLIASLRTHVDMALPLTGPLFAKTPVRFLPYAGNLSGKVRAQSLGSGLLLNDGKRLLVLTAVLGGTSNRFWIRAGLGKISKAEVLSSENYFSVLQLHQPIEHRSELTFAAKPPFPGSIAFSVQYRARALKTLAWPVLDSGFVGNPGSVGSSRSLEINHGGNTWGGPVFDQSGRIIGLAARSNFAHQKQALLITSPSMRSHEATSGLSWDDQAPEAQRPKVSSDYIYGSALKSIAEIFLVIA